MKKILYINGDSYSAPTEYGMYGNVLSHRYNIGLVNKAVIGSSNHRIIRSTLEDCIKFKRQNINVYVIIGLSFFTREEIWSNTDNVFVKRLNECPEGKFVTLDSVRKEDLTIFDKRRLVDLNINVQVVQLLVNIFMLTNTLTLLNIPHFIFSAAHNQANSELKWGYLNQLEVYQDIKKRKNILDIFNFSIPTWAKENNVDTSVTGHLVSIGQHAHFADYLYDNHLSKLNWDINDV